MEEHGARRRIYCGDRIRNSELPRPSWGTLGCFVHTEKGELALLTAPDCLGSPEETKNAVRVVVVRPAMGPEEEEVAVAEQLLREERPLIAPLSSSLAAHSVPLNRVDAAVVGLQPGVTSVQAFRPEIVSGHNLPALRFDPSTSKPSPGTRVFTVWGGYGVAWGVIRLLDVTTSIYGWGGVAWFEGLMMIRGEEGQPFGRPGGSGALVVSEEGDVLGMIIAGKQKDTLACPIWTVLDELACRPLPPGKELDVAPVSVSG